MERVRRAYAALGTGDVEPLVALMHPDMEWPGPQAGLALLAPATFLTRAHRGP
jgi:ketosteroid isomerase-like protein